MRVQLGEIVMIKNQLLAFEAENNWLPGSLSDLIKAHWANENQVLCELDRHIKSLSNTKSLIKNGECGCLTTREKRFLKEFGESK